MNLIAMEIFEIIIAVYNIYNGEVCTTVFPKKQNRYYCDNICLLAVDATCFDPYVGSSSILN
jgi:hypothetical protein